jgi:hypothetical protein
MAFVCDYCGKTFSTKQRLDYHLNKDVCNKGENMKPEQIDEKPVKPIYLFDEQKKAQETQENLVYKCGGCGSKSETKFTTCKACGAENEF